MKQIIAFAIAAMLIAGIMPRVMSQVGSASSETQPVKRAAPAPQPQGGGYRTATLRADSRGHFQVEGAVDGRRLDFMVDTGATVIALRERDAGKLGIFPTPRDYTGRSSTANGIVKVAPVRLPRSRSTASASTTSPPWSFRTKSLSVNLLGMSFLSRLRRFEMANGRLVMEQ